VLAITPRQAGVNYERGGSLSNPIITKAIESNKPAKRSI
jgi:hypothetical protein